MTIKFGRLGAVVVGTTALVTLGGLGGAVASGLVTSSDIKDYTIRAVDLHAASVNSAKIKDGTIRKADLAFTIAEPTPAGAMAYTMTKSATGGDPITFTDDLNCPVGMSLLGQTTGDGTSTEAVTVWVSAGNATLTSYDVNTYAGSNALKGVDNVVVDSSTAGDYTATIKIVCR